MKLKRNSFETVLYLVSVKTKRSGREHFSCFSQSQSPATGS